MNNKIVLKWLTSIFLNLGEHLFPMEYHIHVDVTTNVFYVH